MNRTLIILLIGAGIAAGFMAGVLFQTAVSPEESSPQPVPRAPQSEETDRESADQPLTIAGEMAPEALLVADAREKEDAEIRVSVTGAVRRPGVYRFEQGARVQHGIERAGGLLENADLDDINIAARLLDDTTLFIPFQAYAHREDTRLILRGSIAASEANPPRYTRSGWRPAQAHTPPPTAPSAAPASTASSPEAGTTLIPLNSATSEELQRLPGIGPKTAEKIIAHREQFPFQQVDDLEDVPGIGPKRLEAVRHLVTVD